MDDEEVLELPIISDADHLNPRVTGRLRRDEIQRQGLPVLEGALTQQLRDQLQVAYKDDYGKVVLIFTNNVLRWWKKISFTGRQV
jgi:hypothetical protein